MLVPMLKKIKITPIAAESFGVRSMCTMVETPDVTVLFDAGLSLCPYRFCLPPHPLEFKTIQALRKSVAEAAAKAQVVTISHYHFDHHTPSYEDWVVNWTEANETARQIYQGKKVLMKNPRDKINASQRERAFLFQRTSGEKAEKIDSADAKTFKFGEETVIRFSEAVFHGSEYSSLGWVVMTLVEYGKERFMFSPDIQGPMSTHTLELIKQADPQVIMLGGPPFYLAGFKVSEAQLQLALKNLSEIVEVVPLTILEHHSLRDESWREKTKQIYKKASEARHEIMTAAEFVGKHNNFLEANRKTLYIENPPTKEFEMWIRKGLKKKGSEKPPI
jgi:predicted metallo-beta-lactamase superfamily hydrolase